jgi:hypothetical protein
MGRMSLITPGEHQNVLYRVGQKPTNSSGLFKDNIDRIMENDIASGKLGDFKFQCIRVGSDLNKRRKEALGIAFKQRGRKKRKTTTTTTAEELGDQPGQQQDANRHDSQDEENDAKNVGPSSI